MGLHQRHTAGRVFRGLEAREHLLMHKRDSHGSRLKMNIPDSFKGKLAQEGVKNVQTQDVQTAVQVVYVTLPQTFSGSAVYKTLTGASEPTPTKDDSPHTKQTAEPEPEPKQESLSPSSAKTKASATDKHIPHDTATASSDKKDHHDHTEDHKTTFATTTAPRSSQTLVGAAASITSGGASAIAGSVQSSSSPSSSPQPSGGLSGGAKAGIAIAVLLGLAFIAAAAFFIYRKKKNSNSHEELLDEKHASLTNGAGTRNPETALRPVSVQSEKAAPSIVSNHSASTAPRLSLRPVTQFLPNLGDSASNSGHSSGAMSEKSRSGRENPFADATMSENRARPYSPQANPFEENQRRSPETQQRPAMPRQHDSTSSRGSNERPSTPNSSRSGPPGAAPPGSPMSRGPNNVHRVQLDFKPSMDDELELRSGQLVRMLHEYDDGWALCIRMDRSQQGVAPRTCLSKLAVKPRPQGPPPPQGRPGPSPGPGARRPPPNQPGPNGPNGPMYPRPLTPTQANRNRAPSASNGEPNSSASVPMRKPVPGQAM